MSFPFVSMVRSVNPDFPLRVGDAIRVDNRDGSRDTITLTHDLSRVDGKGRVRDKEFTSVTRRTYRSGNKHQIGTPWCF